MQEILKTTKIQITIGAILQYYFRNANNELNRIKNLNVMKNMWHIYVYLLSKILHENCLQMLT